MSTPESRAASKGKQIDDGSSHGHQRSQPPRSQGIRINEAQTPRSSHGESINFFGDDVIAGQIAADEVLARQMAEEEHVPQMAADHLTFEAIYNELGEGILLDL